MIDDGEDGDGKELSKSHLLQPSDRWGASNLDKCWKKWRMRARAMGKERGEKREDELELGLDDGGLYNDIFSPGCWYKPELKVHL